MTNILEHISIKNIKKGKSIKVKRLKEGHIPEITEFNTAVISFGSIFNKYKNFTVAGKNRIKQSRPEFRIIMFEQNLKAELKVLSHLANSGNPNDAEERFLYQKTLSKIYQAMVEESNKENEKDKLVLLLERGSLLIGSFYQNQGKKVASVLAKRLDMADGTFGLGLSNLIIPKKKYFQKLHIQEDCIASGDSIAGVIFYLYKMAYRFEVVQIDCAVAVQKGVEFLKDFLLLLGIKKILFKTGGICYRVDEHFYLRRTKMEGYSRGEFYVGDMGSWSEPLPVDYNSKAVWNKKRVINNLN